jgi:ABC-type nickel/cobalt efflux system permease component RcnA
MSAGMFGLDEWLAGLGDGSIAVALLLALLLGLRHATDPDHLTAVSTLVMSDERGGRRAGTLGAAWGLGHALTLLALGIPVVLFDDHLPEAVQQAAELAIAVVIVALAVRLLVRWRRGYFHVHEHSHGGRTHAHPHPHKRGEEHPIEHEHVHPEPLGRTPHTAFGIGLVHGVGGSAGASVLLVSAVPGETASAVALLVLAAGTAVSMAALSWGFGRMLASRPLRRRLRLVVPAFGVCGVLFGAWYGLGALGTVPYLF